MNDVAQSHLPGNRYIAVPQTSNGLRSLDGGLNWGTESGIPAGPLLGLTWVRDRNKFMTGSFGSNSPGNAGLFVSLDADGTTWARAGSTQGTIYGTCCSDQTNNPTVLD